MPGEGRYCYPYKLIGVSAYAPGATAQEHKIKLGLIPRKMAGLHCYIRDIDIPISMSINQPTSSGSVIPWEDMFRAVTNVELNTTFGGQLIKANTRGADVGLFAEPFANNYRLLQPEGVGDLPAADATTNRTIMLRVPFADYRFTNPVCFALPAATLTDADYLNITLAPLTGLAAVSTGATIDSISIGTPIANLVLLDQPLKRHYVKRYFAEELSNSAEFSVGPYTGPNRNILDMALAGNCAGLGGGLALSNYLTIEGGRWPSVSPRVIWREFNRQLPAGRSDANWPCYYGEAADLTGEDSHETLSLILPLEYVDVAGGFGKGDIRQIVPRPYNLKITTTQTSAASHRVLMCTVDDYAPRMETALAQLFAAA